MTERKSCAKSESLILVHPLEKLDPSGKGKTPNQPARDPIQSPRHGGDPLPLNDPLMHPPPPHHKWSRFYTTHRGDKVPTLAHDSNTIPLPLLPQNRCRSCVPWTQRRDVTSDRQGQRGNNTGGWVSVERKSWFLLLLQIWKSG